MTLLDFFINHLLFEHSCSHATAIFHRFFSRLSLIRDYWRLCVINKSQLPSVVGNQPKLLSYSLDESEIEFCNLISDVIVFRINKITKNWDWLGPQFKPKVLAENFDPST